MVVLTSGACPFLGQGSIQKGKAASSLLACFLLQLVSIWGLNLHSESGRGCFQAESGQLSFGRLPASGNLRPGTEITFQFQDDALSWMESGQLSFGQLHSAGNVRLGTEIIFQGLDESLSRMRND